jgi:hypothetical protein
MQALKLGYHQTLEGEMDSDIDIIHAIWPDM